MKIEKIISKVLSIFFRLILVSYGIFIVSSYQNYFQNFWYFIAIIPYLFVYFVTLFKDGIFAKIRLLNDFIFIVFILYNKPVDYTTISFLLLPIVNSPNYTGNKKSFWLYIFFIASLYIINRFQFDWSFVFVTIIFITINFVIDSKSSYYENITKLNLQIEDFFENEFDLRKSYKFYIGILTVLNKIHVLFLYRPKFDNIVCFKINSNSLVFENSSSFIWSYNIDNDLIFNLINQDNLDNFKCSNIEVNLNGINYNKNFIVFNQTSKTKYVFVFTINEYSNNLFNLYYINLLKPITSRISRLLDLEHSIQIENKNILKKFRDKYFHMQNAETAMHFIRNRFNTLDNFIEMSKDNIAGNMDMEDKIMYETELQRLERNYEMLMNRVSNILNKSDKPFSATQLEKKSPNFLYSSVRGIWLDYFKNFNPELNWDIKKTDEYLVEISNDGLYIILTDWITNLKKYSNNNESVVFNEDEFYFKVVFRNEFNPSLLDDILSLKEDFNSVDRDRILKRTSHGVLIMKSILEEMSVLGNIENDEKNIELTLSFKKIGK